jgi:hypothetical protein
MRPSSDRNSIADCALLTEQQEGDWQSTSLHVPQQKLCGAGQLPTRRVSFPYFKYGLRAARGVGEIDRAHPNLFFGIFPTGAVL